MIVRDLADAEKTDRRVTSQTWESTRLLLRSDQMGFSFHVTTIYAGTTTPMWYRNHLEAVLCIQGDGEIETNADGKVYQIRPGVMYALDKNDKHVLRARSEMKMVCVFNPPLMGKEVHGADGAYPLEAEEVHT
ncbi:MAG: ectoine synthase [Bryobacterales bacterium]|nr:ectoine synthase [Acidobacteriota bacterium]MCB9385494.1 ectoine synthase [Bryobacterales bacterium]